MILPRTKRPDRQLRLFDADRLIKSDGERRWAVGDFYEQLTAELTGAARLQTDSRATVCPDLQHSERVFFEAKAVGKTGKVILYTGRQTRYRDFTAAGYEIIHWIWSHNFRASNAAYYSELNANLARCTRRLFIVDFAFLLEFCGQPPRLINSQYNRPRTGRNRRIQMWYVGTRGGGESIGSMRKYRNGKPGYAGRGAKSPRFPAGRGG